MRAKKTATQNATEAENGVKNDDAGKLSGEAEKTQETANNNDTEGKESFIYLGPTTNTGLIQNTIFTGTRENVEEYLEKTVEEIPQVKLLIVPTKSLAESRAKVRKAGTLLNKYYNDVLSLSRKNKG